jgi:excisionase family DNA binding protein
MRARMIAPEQRGRGGCRKRPPLDLPVLSVPVGIPLDEYAVPVRQAAELLGVSYQTVHAQIERRTLPAYLHEGRKHVLLEDLAQTRTARAQAAQEAEQDRLAFWSKDLHENRMPEWMTGGPVPCPDWCVYPGCQDTLAVGASDD